MSETMLAARTYVPGEAMRLERIPVPAPRPTDVLVRVRACGIVPNLGNVLKHWQGWFPELPLPPMPAIFGLDAVGEIEAVGSQVLGWTPGDRVYCNPGLSCGACRACRAGEMLNCTAYTFRGYFGFGPNSTRLFEAYPYGGLCEKLLAPANTLVKLPDKVSWEQAARFGYLGTAYAGVRKSRVGPGDTLLINGITGTLGLGAALIALGRGVTRILGTARDAGRLARLEEIGRGRIATLRLGTEDVAGWARARNDGEGIDAVIDCVGPGAPPQQMMDSIYALRRGGRVVNIGGTGARVVMDVHWMMDEQIELIGSNWFSAAEGDALAEMARAGTLDLSVFEHVVHPLENINDALRDMPERNGGFTNLVIRP
jgi:threonine dehydrogenase-like Zn-dependent dehydrogenase